MLGTLAKKWKDSTWGKKIKSNPVSSYFTTYIHKIGIKEKKTTLVVQRSFFSPVLNTFISSYRQKKKTQQKTSQDSLVCHRSDRDFLKHQILQNTT